MARVRATARRSCSFDVALAAPDAPGAVDSAAAEGEGAPPAEGEGACPQAARSAAPASRARSVLEDIAAVYARAAASDRSFSSSVRSVLPWPYARFRTRPPSLGDRRFCLGVC